MEVACRSSDCSRATDMAEPGVRGYGQRRLRLLTRSCDSRLGGLGQLAGLLSMIHGAG